MATTPTIDPWLDGDFRLANYNNVHFQDITDIATEEGYVEPEVPDNSAEPVEPAVSPDVPVPVPPVPVAAIPEPEPDPQPFTTTDENGTTVTVEKKKGQWRARNKHQHSRCPARSILRQN